ncbi:MAG: hypothetical protein FWF03_08455 [Defluviitaleaceae bacterium]|nr:hypothetical protein [Defluviitaleaceae bacterium]
MQTTFKSIFSYPLILTVLLTSGCGAPKGPADEGYGGGAPGLDENGISSNSYETGADESDIGDFINIASGDYDYTSEFLTIVWGLHWLNPNRAVIYPAKSKIADALNERFNVGLETVLVNSMNFSEYVNKLADENLLPDIFSTNGLNEGALIEKGALKKIPWDMVKRYVPRYYALLALNAELLDGYLNPKSDSDAYLMPAVEYREETLEFYSIYRYDWLEEIGIIPKGEITMIGNGVYFTETPFSYYELLEILDLFAATRQGRQAYNLGETELRAQGMLVSGSLSNDYFRQSTFWECTGSAPTTWSRKARRQFGTRAKLIKTTLRCSRALSSPARVISRKIRFSLTIRNRAVYAAALAWFIKGCSAKPASSQTQ